MNALCFFADVTDADEVGGKGGALAELARAGFAVPAGFCLTTAAYRQGLSAELRQQIRDAYQQLGSGSVAVRSSATGEDGAETSFAGQQETILAVNGEAALFDAITRCWESLHTDRAKAYRRKQGVADDSVVMALVVQVMIPADTAGVLFTQDPLDADGQRMLVEASWGLGESVVSGRVTPDQYHLDRSTGVCLHRQLGRKTEQLIGSEVVPIDEAKQQEFCLDDNALSLLAELGKRVELHYGSPRDIEWAIADGKLWLLQARPITTVMAVEREAVRQAEQSAAAQLAEVGGSVWARIHMAEILPEPTPLTWAIAERMLAADGGTGRMNRDLGASPDTTLGSRSAYDLIAGRPYANLPRMPRMQFRYAPFVYPLERYREQPALALDPKPRMQLINGLRSIFMFPLRLAKVFGSSMRTQSLATTFAEPFRTKIVPEFVAECERAESEDWSTLDDAALLGKLQFWIDRALVQFASNSLKPTAFADMSWQVVQQALQPKLGVEGAQAALGELTLGAHPDREVDLPFALQQLAAGELTRDEFLARFGHRGRSEMELSQPRWREDAASLDALLGSVTIREPLPEPNWELAWDRIAGEAKIANLLRPQLRQHIAQVRTYFGLREVGKHQLMRGYALIRRAIVELGQRHQLADEIFYLLPDELPQLGKDESLRALAKQRQRTRQIALSFEMPAVLFSADLDAIGRPTPLPEGDHLQGTALSAGFAEASALVLMEPTTPPPNEAYILVCPSTDPAWVPLFAQARGLVMENGGVLSHGAIVAREFGLPAVAGIPGLMRRLQTGQRLRIDGGRGTVTILPAL